MTDQLWDLFRETGEPRGYLLYKAEMKREQKKKPDKAAPGPQPQPKGTPPASV